MTSTYIRSALTLGALVLGASVIAAPTTSFAADFSGKTV